MNLRILKNKIVLVLIVVLGIGLLTVSKQNDDMPEDNFLSSGNSIIWGNMDKFNNYENVKQYAYKQNNAMNKRESTLNEKSYYFLEKIEVFDEEDEYPQGLCFTEDYICISSYSGIKGRLGRVKFFDKQTGECLLTLGMDENSHLGGLAYDGKNVWLCNSSKMAIERISYAFIKHLIHENRGQMIDARNLVDVYQVKNIPSCVTYYDGQLWVASHSVLTNAFMMSYQYKEGDGLHLLRSFWIPPKVQGVAFSEQGEVYLSVSYGRKNSSYIKKYVSLEVMSKNVNAYMERIELPPCSEEIVFENNNIYIVFESAGKKYLDGTDGKGKSVSPLNRILVLESKKSPIYK